MGFVQPSPSAPAAGTDTGSYVRSRKRNKAHWWVLSSRLPSFLIVTAKIVLRNEPCHRGRDFSPLLGKPPSDAQIAGGAKSTASAFRVPTQRRSAQLSPSAAPPLRAPHPGRRPPPCRRSSRRPPRRGTDAGPDARRPAPTCPVVRRPPPALRHNDLASGNVCRTRS